MVVHCSAGVGRTGTFVTIDTNIEMIEAEGKVDVFNFVRGLRWKRNYMVQTEVSGAVMVFPLYWVAHNALVLYPQPQYVFIYDALAEYHNCGDTSVVATNLKKQLNALQEKNEKTGLTGYEEQYQVLLISDSLKLALILLLIRLSIYFVRNCLLFVPKKTRLILLLL